MIDPYAKIARWYDAEFEGASADIRSFVARNIGPRVLVLGCGTGRVCRGFPPDRHVVGLDLSAPMIEAARARGGEYHVGDMRHFDLGGFDEVIIPNGSFAFLRSRADRAACLAACARAAAVVTIDVPMPDYALLGQPHTPERPAWQGAVDGVDVRRTREVFRDPVAQRLRLVDRYYSGGEPIVSELVLHLFTRDEMEWMLEAAGFYVDEAWGDHAGGAVREGCDRLLVRAVRF